MTDLVQFDRTLDWDRFVAASPQGTVFCESRFLDAAGAEFETLGVSQDGRPEVAAIIVYGDHDEPVRAPAPYSLYQGMLFSEKWAVPLNQHTIARMIPLVSELLESLSARSPRISLCLHPSIRDVRPFLWFHHSEPELGRFRVDVRYTATLDLEGIGDRERHLHESRTARRQDYSRALKQGFAMEVGGEVDELLRLYKATFERQDVVVADRDLGLVESITRKSLKEGFGRLYVIRSPAGEAVSMVLFLHDRDTGYYLFGASDPAFRRSGASTQLLFDAIWRLREETGVRTIDMVGANSPNRGDYKLSFGATLEQYFVVDWERP